MGLGAARRALDEDERRFQEHPTLKTTSGQIAPPTSGHPLRMPPGSGGIPGRVHFLEVPFDLMLSLGWLRADLMPGGAGHVAQEFQFKIAMKIHVFSTLTFVLCTSSPCVYIHGSARMGCDCSSVFFSLFFFITLQPIVE